MLSFLLLGFVCFQADSAKLMKQNLSDNEIVIYGSCWDANSGVNLMSMVTAFTNGRKIDLGRSNDEARYHVKVPNGARSITFESEGFIPRTVPVHVMGKVPTEAKFDIWVPMIMPDSQQVILPYASKIKENDLSSSRPGANNGKKIVFEVLDAHLRRKLMANICLTNSRTGSKTCVDTDSVTLLASIDIQRGEKFTIEVKSDWYEGYTGPLNIEAEDMNARLCQIRLLKVLDQTQFYTNMPDTVKIDREFRSLVGHGWSAGSYAQSRKHVGNTILVALHSGPGELTAKTSDGRFDVQTRFNAKPGLNFGAVEFSETKVNSLDTLKVIARLNPMTRRTLYFDQSNYRLRKEVKDALDSMATLLAADTNYVIYVTGHTDNVGRRNLNVILSEHRVRVVSNYLEQKGIKSGRVVSAWEGPDSPASPNDVEENRVKNRRVEVRVLPR